jgi:beta-N-acetylhexosaminidase
LAQQNHLETAAFLLILNQLIGGLSPPNRHLLPLTLKRVDQNSLVLYQRVKPAPSTAMVILCDRLSADDGHVLEREVRQRASDAEVIYVDPRVAAARTDLVLSKVDQARAVVVAVYVVPSAARTRTVARGQKNSSSLPDSTARLLSAILARAKDKTAVLAMGNPYLTGDFPTIQTYICTFSNATVSEVSAARALFGEIPLSGHMPVNIRTATVAPAATPSLAKFTLPVAYSSPTGRYPNAPSAH